MQSRQLWFLFQQAAETAIKFKLYLAEVKSLSSEKDNALVEFLENQANQSLKELLFWIGKLPKPKPIPHEDELDRNTVEDFLGPCVKSVAKLKGLHHHFQLFTTHPLIPPEVRILLTDLFPKETFPNQQSSVAVAYFPDHNFECDRIPASYEPTPPAELNPTHRELVVLRMPYMEFQNPLMWTNLVHEIGHSLDEGHKFVEEITIKYELNVQKPQETKIVQDWSSELFADRVAVETMGPAYLCAIGTWFAVHNPTGLAVPTNTHPSPCQRILFMRRYLEDNGFLTAGANHVLSVLDALKPFYPGKPEADPSSVSPESLAEDSANTLSKLDKDKMERYCAAHTSAVQSLLDPLNRNVVIPSRMSEDLPPGHLEGFLKFLETGKVRTSEELYSAAHILQEEPNTSREIINAGWEYKLSKGLNEFIAVMLRGRTDSKRADDAIEEYGEYVTSFERRLRKSVETARLHRIWKAAQLAVRRGMPAENRPEALRPLSEPAKVLLGHAKEEREPSLLNERQILRRLHPQADDRIVITPILNIKDQIQPTAVDLRLGTEFGLIRSSRLECLNVLQSKEDAKLEVSQYFERIHISPEEKFVLHPGEFALGCTLEYITLPPDIAGRLEGKSTWGRMGLQIHSTAGFVDPGFEGALTFELQNVGRVPIPLYPGMRVAQICFYQCEASAIPYSQKSDAHYLGNPGLMFSQFFKLPDQGVLSKIHDASKKKK